jgi:hypothetical protein
MTEQELQERTGRQTELLDFFRNRVSERKMRLLVCACCRASDPGLSLSRVVRSAVEVIENNVDGSATKGEMKKVSDAAMRAYFGSWPAVRDGAQVKGTWLARLVGWAATRTDEQFSRTAELMSQPTMWDNLGLSLVTLNQRIHCIFGNSDYPVVPELTWLTPTVRTLAETSYLERDTTEDSLNSSRLAVLADALEDAGCTDADILEHLRGDGPHVRGCWAVDLLLGKE